MTEGRIRDRDALPHQQLTDLDETKAVAEPPLDRSLRGARNEQLRTILPPTFDVTLVSFDGGAMYFFWVREPVGWRIVHANLTCV